MVVDTYNEFPVCNCDLPKEPQSDFAGGVLMKRFLVLFIMFALLSFSACNNNTNDPIDTTTHNESTNDLTDATETGKNDRDPLNIAISINRATDAQLSNAVDYTHFFDQDSMDTTWKVVVTVNAQISSLSFVELDESEHLKLGETLYEAKSPQIGSSYIFHTYINDATINRGISYVDQDGQTRHFAININMDNGAMYLSEIEF